MTREAFDQLLRTYLRRSIAIRSYHAALRPALLAFVVGAVVGLALLLMGYSPWWLMLLALPLSAVVFVWRNFLARRRLATPWERLGMLSRLEGYARTDDAILTLDGGVVPDFEAPLRARIAERLHADTVRAACPRFNFGLTAGAVLVVALSICCVWWLDTPQVRGVLALRAAEGKAHAQPQRTPDPSAQPAENSASVSGQGTDASGGTGAAQGKPDGAGGTGETAQVSGHVPSASFATTAPRRPWESGIPSAAQAADVKDDVKDGVSAQQGGDSHAPPASAKASPPPPSPFEAYRHRDFHIIPEAADGDRQTVAARRDVYDPRSSHKGESVESSAMPRTAADPKRDATEYGGMDEGERAWAAHFMRQRRS